MRYSHVGDVTNVYKINVRSTILLTWEAVEVDGDVDLASDIATRRYDAEPVDPYTQLAALVRVAGICDLVAVDVGVWHAVAAVAVDGRLLAESGRVERQPSVERRPCRDHVVLITAQTHRLLVARFNAARLRPALGILLKSNKDEHQSVEDCRRLHDASEVLNFTIDLMSQAH